ncbi:coiled-coil domain-containing protein 66 isoform X2 [Nelusetta ayraudi]|uniref:coiled-coil domain-containing protein 66 isoform X2 n=1 Tax=Nelusetta ayraudi TaxID=303726 RepID=UPI003F7078B6
MHPPLAAGADKNPAKLPCRPRATKILSSRQLSSVDPLQGDERFARLSLGRQRDTRTKTREAAALLASSSVGRSSALTHKAGNGKKLTKGKPERHKNSASAATPRSIGTTEDKTQGGSQGSGDVVLKDSVVSLAQEQLQQILNTVETNRNGPKEEKGEHKESQGNQTDSQNEEDGQGEETKAGGEGGGSDPSASLQDTRFPGVLFSWLDERQSESRDAADARKARWRRELDEQVALKQQQLVPSRAQAEEDVASLLSFQSSFRHRDVPTAIRSSLKIGEVTPMEEVVNVKKKEEQRRRWLEELDKQREETSERRRREKLLESQTEDHELWVSHFDSLQRRPPIQFAAPFAHHPPPPPPPHHHHHHHPPPPPPPPLGPSCLSDRGEWEPSSSLSLAWEGLSSCGADSVYGASVVDAASRHPTRSSYLRSMTALLDPSQLEERERKRLKQLEQQRAIEAQVEERRRQKEQEEARQRDEEEREERRLAAEREAMQRRYEEDALRNREKEQLGRSACDGDEAREEEAEPKDAGRGESVEAGSSTLTHRDTAVQTAVPPPADDRDRTPGSPAQRQPALPSRRNRALRTGKENICLPGGADTCSAGGDAGGDPYEAFARTERSKRQDKRRPEWNTQRPSRQFVPASERYPAPLQRNRQESRLKRQAELLALQERACPSRSTAPPQQQHHHHQSLPGVGPRLTQSRESPGRRVEAVSRRQSRSAAFDPERGRSPPVPTLRNGVHSLQAASSAPTPPPAAPQLAVDFIPYIRTDEVLNQDPVDPADDPPALKHTEASPLSSAAPPVAPHRDRLLRPEPPANSHTQRQQEILRGLAQLRQGLLQKQRELEMDLNPLLRPRANIELQ